LAEGITDNAYLFSRVVVHLHIYTAHLTYLPPNREISSTDLEEVF
jgi:hypothetical protein